MEESRIEGPGQYHKRRGLRPGGNFNDLSVFNFNGSNMVTLYIEGINPSAALADVPMTVTLDPDGTGPQSIFPTDAGASDGALTPHPLDSPPVAFP